MPLDVHNIPKAFHPLCDYCIHLPRGLTAKGCLPCDAFPQGVPTAILDETADHRRPYPGDHGIQFELNPARREDFAARLS